MTKPRPHPPEGLPGEELVAQGLSDLASSRETEAAVLVEIAAPRLGALGVTIPCACVAGDQSPEHRLYALLTTAPDAHSRYNALLRRIASYAAAAEREMS